MDNNITEEYDSITNDLNAWCKDNECKDCIDSILMRLYNDTQFFCAAIETNIKYMTKVQ